MAVDFSLQDMAQLRFNTQGIVKYNSDPYTSSNSVAITNFAYGLNHRQQAPAIPMNKDNYGLTFFTRPQLNMTSPNLRSDRIMVPLLTTTDKSWHRAVRCLLDPRLYYAPGEESGGAIKCPLVDPMQAFIPLLTNALKSISGWPDTEVPTWTSPAGIYKEEWSIADGNSKHYGAFDLTATFRNFRGDAISKMFHYWCHYQSLVFEGRLSPYADMIAGNEIDYQTRIYRIILDPSMSKVQNIAACGAAFPVASPMGAKFDFSSEKPYNDANSDIQIPFRCMGFIADDDILIRTFNTTVGIFNPDMYGEALGGAMVKLPLTEIEMFNFRGYPYINPDTFEMEWYVPAELYQAKMTALANFDQMLDGALGFSLF